MKQFFITLGAVLVGQIVGLFLFMILLLSIPAMIIGSMASKAEPPASSMMLEVDMRNPISDQRLAGPFGLFSPNLATVDIVRKLEAAATDPKVKGVLVRASTSGMAPSQGEEFRTALNKVRAAGKFVIAHIQNDGVTTSLMGYTAVAGANEIWLQETGQLMPMGIASQGMYFGGALQKFRITAQFEAREEYKDAVTQYTERGPTAPSRQATKEMLESIYNTAIASIAADRKLTPAAVKAAIEATPMSGADAIKAKLIDKLGRPEDAEQRARDKADGADLINIARYRAPKESGPVIALVAAEGEIVSGPPAGPSFGGGALINSDATSAALLEAANDDSVKAIVFRVSSPGGSAVASDQISHAVGLARAKGKKIVVSMGPYAASGGYYISAGADAIVASPTTITGSIGIFGGKIVFGDALEHYLGVTTATQQIGSPYVAMFDATRPFTNAERQVFAKYVDDGYADFLNVVATGRKMTPEQARAVAKGRVWTGEQAKTRGLVDELGGLDVAIARAKRLAGLKANAKITLKQYPRAAEPFEDLRDLFGAGAEAARAAALVSVLMGDEETIRAVQQAKAQQGVRARAALEEVR